MTEYLNSFVGDGDTKLLNILKRIKDGTLKKDVSLLILEGGVSSGKSTLMEVMKQLSPTSYTTNYEILSRHWPIYKDQLEQLNSHVIFFPEPLSKNIVKINELIIKSDYNVRPFYENNLLKLNLGVGIVSHNSHVEIENLSVKSGRKREPIYLHLPHSFENNLDRNYIVDQCLKEFEQWEYEQFLLPPKFFTLMLCIKRLKYNIYKDLRVCLFKACLNRS